MRNLVILTLVLAFMLGTGPSWSGEEDEPVVVYPASSGFEDVIDNIKMRSKSAACWSAAPCMCRTC